MLFMPAIERGNVFPVDKNKRIIAQPFDVEFAVMIDPGSIKYVSVALIDLFHCRNLRCCDSLRQHVEDACRLSQFDAGDINDRVRRGNVGQPCPSGQILCYDLPERKIFWRWPACFIERRIVIIARWLRLKLPSVIRAVHKTEIRSAMKHV